MLKGPKTRPNALRNYIVFKKFFFRLHAILGNFTMLGNFKLFKNFNFTILSIFTINSVPWTDLLVKHCQSLKLLAALDVKRSSSVDFVIDFLMCEEAVKCCSEI